jgi:phosphoribosyl-ATP pyrophosphohydrolase
MNDLINKYTDLGVKRDKIFVSTQPAMATWSYTRKCVVGENGVETLEIVPTNDGNHEITFKNNVRVSLLCYDTLPVKKINDSDGIIITAETYGKPYFRFGFIPERESDNVYGYHTTEIKKGEIGTISKIQEELDELKDAEKQESKIMMMVELSDLYGALEEYCLKQDITMEDLRIFSDITKRAFKNGRR